MNDDVGWPIIGAVQVNDEGLIANLLLGDKDAAEALWDRVATVVQGRAAHNLGHAEQDPARPCAIRGNVYRNNFTDQFILHHGYLQNWGAFRNWEPNVPLDEILIDEVTRYEPIFFNNFFNYFAGEAADDLLTRICGSFVRRRVENNEVALADRDAVCQDLVMKFALDKRVRARWMNAENPYGFLNRSVMNGINDYFRQLNRYRQHRQQYARDNEGVHQHDEMPDMDRNQDGFENCVKLGLNALTNRQRQVVLLRTFQEQPQIAVARELGLAPGTVGRYHFEGLQSLLQYINERCPQFADALW